MNILPYVGIYCVVMAYYLFVDDHLKRREYT